MDYDMYQNRIFFTLPPMISIFSHVAIIVIIVIVIVVPAIPIAIIIDYEGDFQFIIQFI